MPNPRKVARKANSGKFVGGYKILGKTDDGVRILKPKGKPASFTVVRLKKAIASTRAKKAG